MKKALFCFIFILAVSAIFAQSRKDSYNRFVGFLQSGQYQEAFDESKNLLPLIQKENGIDSVYIDVLYYAAYAAFSIQDYNSARELSTIEVSIRKKATVKPQQYYNSVYMLSVYKSYLKEYDDAALLMQEVTNYINKTYGHENINAIHTSNQLANIYNLAGATFKAKMIYEENYSIVKKLFTPSDSMYRVMANTISVFYTQSGDYEKSEPFFTESISIAEKNASGRENETFLPALKNLVDFYIYAHWFDKAEKYYLEYCSLTGKLFGKKHERYITVLNSLGEFYINAGLYEKAETTFAEFVKLCENFYGKKSADYATALNNLAVAYEKQSKYNEAEKIYLKCLSIKESVFKKESDYYALSLINLGILYDYMGKYNEAEKNLLEAIDIYQKINKTETDNYFTALSSIASVYSSKGKNSEAVQLLENALASVKEKKGEISNLYVTALNNLANVLVDLGEFDKAETYFEKTIQLREKLLGPNHTEVGITLFNLANLKNERGNYEDALSLYKRAKKIQENALGKNAPAYANVVQSMASLYAATGNYRLAEENYLECENVYKSVYGKMHPELAIFLNNFGYFYFEKGDFENSKIYYSRSLEINHNAYGQNHLKNVPILSNMANLFIARHEYKYAEENLLAAQKIILTNGGESLPEYGALQNNLATLYYRLGNYENAQRYYDAALVARKKLYGIKHKEYSTALNNLGALFLAKAVDEKEMEKAASFAKNAQSFFEQALGIDSLNGGIKNPDMAGHLNNLAEAFRIQNKPLEAEKLYEATIAMEKLLYGEKNSHSAITYHNLALLASGNGDYQKAEKMAKQSLQLFEASYGKNCAASSGVTVSMAYILENLNKNELALEYYQRAVKLQKHELENNFSFLSEAELEKYLATLTHYQNMFKAFAYTKNNPGGKAFTTVFENEIYYKGILLRSSSRLRTLVAQSNDTSLINLFNNWNDVKQKLSSLYASGDKENEITLLEEKVMSIEKSLANKSSTVKNSALSNISFSSISTQLPANALAIEFFEMKIANDSANFLMAAVFDHKSMFPQIIKLCETKSVIQIIGNFGANNLDYVKNIYGTKDYFDSKLYKLIFSSLEQFMEGKKELYFAPVGVLHKVAFAALRNDKREYLSARFQLHQLSCSSQIIDLNNVNVVPSKSSLLVMGGVKYNLAENKNIVWDYLPGTKEEGEKIVEILKKSGTNISFYSGIDATENQVKKLSGHSPNLIHVATHGFFYSDPYETVAQLETKVSDVNFRGGTRGIDAFVENTNPLMRSGIVLAGANDAWTNEEKEEEDGVLTAYEVSLLDLSNTNLAVLSACETGLGDIKGNEGVYGLQRAFRIAGVKHLIMSLWRVPDKETKEFMVEFYSQLVASKNIKAAFENAKTTMRQKYDPYYWAAFMLLE